MRRGQKCPWYFWTLHIRRGMPKTAVDLPSESFASMSFKVRSHRCSLVLSCGELIFFPFPFLFLLLLSRSNRIRYGKTPRFVFITANQIRVTRERAWPKDSTKVLDTGVHINEPVSFVLLRRGKLQNSPHFETRGEREREHFPRILPRREIRLFGKNITNRAIPPNECGFLTFSPVRRLFVSRVERDSPSRPSKTCLKATERYRTLHSCPNTTGDRKKKKEINKERKKIFDTYVSCPFFFFFLTRMSSHSHSSNRTRQSIRRENGGRRGCDQVGTVSHKRNASTLVPIIHFYATSARLHRIPSPSSIGKPRYPVINVFHHRGHPLLLLGKDRKDTPTPNSWRLFLPERRGRRIGEESIFFSFLLVQRRVTRDVFVRFVFSSNQRPWTGLI